MNLLRVALATACVLSSLPAIAETGFLDRAVNVKDFTFRYQVYVPLTWTASEKWPVVLYLHGSDPVGTDGMSHVNGANGNAIRGDRARFPAVFVFPQARAAWSTAPMQDMALAALDAAVSEFNGDLDRIYLTGFSLGGAGVVRIAGRWPERFAALIDVAGRIKPDWQGRQQATIDQDKLTHPFLAGSDPYTGLASVIRHLPILVFHGDADATAPVADSRALVAALKAAGAPVRYTEYPNTDHNPTNVNVWAEKELMAWLLAQRRNVTARRP